MKIVNFVLICVGQKKGKTPTLLTVSPNPCIMNIMFVSGMFSPVPATAEACAQGGGEDRAGCVRPVFVRREKT